MKKKILNFVTIASVLLLSPISFSYNHDPVLFSDIEISSERKTKLAVINSEGKLLLSKLINSSTFIFDSIEFSKFSRGEYVIELHEDLEINIYKMIISDSGLVDIIHSNKFYKPYIFNRNNKIFVNQLNLTSTNIEISILYEDEMIFKEAINNNIKLERVYSLDKYKKGRYELLVTSNGKSFSSIFYL